MYRLALFPERTRWIATLYPCITYTDKREEAVTYEDRTMAFTISQNLRNQGRQVIALPDTEDDVTNSTDRVGGLKPLLLPAPSPLAAEAEASISSIGQAQPGHDDPQDGEIVPSVGATTTNTACAIPATREQITQAFINAMGLE